HRVATRQQLAGSAARGDPPCIVDDLDLHVRVYATDGRDTTLERIVAGTLEADRTGLSHTVTDGHLRHVHVGDDAAHHRDRAWRAGHDAGAQRDKTDPGELWMLELGNEHRRHTVRRGTASALHRLQREQRIESLSGEYAGSAMSHGCEHTQHHAKAMVKG